MITIKDNLLIRTGNRIYSKINDPFHKHVCGVIVDAKHNIQNKGFKHIVVLDADESDGGDIVSDIEYTYETTFGMPLVSFNLLARLVFHRSEEIVDQKYRNGAIKMLRDGVIRVIDYVPDSTIPVSDEEIEKWFAAKRKDQYAKMEDILKRKGYTLLITSSLWHKPSTVVLENKESKEYYLIAQDEDTYFGVELPECPKTVVGGYKILAPKITYGKNCLRQGEWFFVPTNESKVPRNEDAIITNVKSFWMGKEEDGNTHVVTCEEMRVGIDGRVFVMNGEMSHEDHEQLFFDHSIWYEIVKNTAIRSYSQEGVD